MSKTPKYFIVEAEALPEIFLKVAQAKRLLETGGARTGTVPFARTPAGGAGRPGSAIEQMSDREFAAFSKRAQEAMMAGKKVRME